MAWMLKLLFIATLVVGCLATGAGEAPMTATAPRAAPTPTSTAATTTAKPSTAATTTAKPSTAATTTTKPSTAATTTTKPSTAATTTTKPSPAATTTTKPSPAATTTTKPSTAATTTTKPSTAATTTTKPSTAATTTTKPSTAATTTVESSTRPPSTTVPPTPETPDACSPNPCKDGSKCESRADQAYVCMCLTGDDYDYVNKTCLPAKVFPGEVTLLNQAYEESLTDPTSPLFLKLSTDIIKNIEKAAFKPEDDYKNSTVLAFREKKQRESGIIASVQIRFSENSPMTKEKLTKDLKEQGFTSLPLCDSKPYPCDKQTTTCEEKEGLATCTCLPGYIVSDFTNRACTSCPIGEHPDKSGKCQSCDFGYSGFDCRDSWKLTLVIVGSVLGGLLLITIILLPIVAKKSSKKSSKKNKMVGNGKPNMSQKSLAPAPMVHNGLAESRPVSAQGGSSNGLATFANAGVPRIPRASTNSGWDRSSNLEMTPSHSRQNLISGGRNMHIYDDPDDTNANAFTRPQSNPYAQNRPTFNPYGQSRGQSNPYFASDVGRRY